MAAWKQTFDAFLQEREGPPFGVPGVVPRVDTFRPFTEQDYLDHVDGRPRLDGVRQFLASRQITLPEGAADDPPDRIDSEWRR